MKDIIKYSTKELIIILSIIIVVITSLIIILDKKEDKVILEDKEVVEKLVLFGDKEITLEKDSFYNEPGYYAITNYGEIIDDDIKVSLNNLDTSKVGTYYISYQIDNIVETRKIIIVESKKDNIDNDTVSLELNGDTMIVLEQGEKYFESGFKAVSKVDGDITDKVIIKGSVDENNPGTYILTYEIVDSSGKDDLKTRTVIVKEGIVNVNITGNLETKTSDNITLTITITGNNFSYIKYPNSVVSKEKISTYVIEKNGTYKFLIYDKSYNYIEKEIKVVNIDKTVESKKDLKGTCNVTLKNGKTTFKVTASNASNYNYNSIYQSSNSTYTIDGYNRENNYVIISDKLGNKNKINCLTKMESLPAISSKGEIKYQANTETLKIKITKDSGFYLSYVWVYDAVNQFRKQYTTSSSKIVKDILEIATKNNNLKDKYLVGFNASPPVNSKYYDDWNKDSNYKLKEPLPLMLYNGNVLVNDPNKESDLYIYYIDSSNNLKYTDKVSNLSVAERKKIYDNIIKSGAKNTITWRPILVDNYKALTLDADFLKRKADPDRKQAICQVDSNNFIIITSENSSKGKINYPNFTKYLENLGCHVAMEFDAGGSTSLVFKPKGTNTITKVTGGERELTSAMYFTEL